MTKKETAPVALRREPEPERRRVRWWAVLLVVLVLVAVGAVGWVYRYRLAEMFEQPATLPPPPPGGDVTPAEGGDGAEVGPLYATDFEGADAAADWETFDDGIISAAVEGGELRVGVKSLVDTGTWSGLNYTFEDFVLEVDAAKREGSDDNSVLIVFRLTDGDNYNRVDISADGYYALSRVRGGVSEVVSDWHPSPAIQTGDATNRVRVEAVGDTFRFLVNGEALPLCVSYEAGVRPLWQGDECLGGEVTETWQNADLPAGKIGLGAQGLTAFDGEQSTMAETLIAFDNLTITAPGAE